MWNFRKKLFWDNFSEILWKTKAILKKICEISPYFLQFYYVLKNCVKKFTQVLSCAVCTLRRRQVHKKITKRRYREEKPGHFVFEKPVLFILCLGLTTPYSLGLLIWKFYQTFFILCIEFWLRFELQIRPTRFSINLLFITVRVERKVRLCVKLFHFFLGEYSSDWREICRVLSQTHSRFLREISGKNYFGTIFLKFYEKPRLSSKIFEISSYFVQFNSVLKNCIQKFKQVLSCCVCTLRRRHVHKQITKRRYR